MLKQTKTSFAIFAIVGIAVLGLLTLALMKDFGQLPEKQSESMGPIGVPYTLTDQNGAKFSSTQLQDKYQIVYFGFTVCPDICPMELQKITTALKEAGDSAAHIQPVFITIDPVRDTPAVLKDYLANFDKRYIGLTGTEEEIDAVLAGFKVYASKINDPKFSEYMMDHSSFIYFLGPNYELIRLFGKDDKPADIAAVLKAVKP